MASNEERGNKNMRYILIAFGLITSICAISIASVAPNTTARLEKYHFPNLESVDGIYRYGIDGWSYVDPRSIIVDISPGRSYLLIFNREENDFRFTEHVSFSHTGSEIRARFDSVRPIQRYNINIPVTIAKIYKLNGRADKKAVRAQIKAPQVKPTSTEVQTQTLTLN
jgi:hypothetical protein